MSLKFKMQKKVGKLPQKRERERERAENCESVAVEDGAIRVRFDRVTDFMVQSAERFIQTTIVIENRAPAVDINRRPNLFGDLLEIHSLAVKLAIAIAK